MPNALTTQTGLPALTEEDIALMVAAQGDVEQTSTQGRPPFLFIVQGSSDYVKRGEAKFVDAARAGDIMDTLALTPMQEAYVIPCKFEEHSSEWKPNRGGLVKQYWTDHSHYQAAAKKGADDFDGMPRVNEAGNDVTLVPTYYALLVNPATGRARPVEISMAGTQAKKSRRWNALIDIFEFPGPNGTMLPAPFYARCFRLTTVNEPGKDNSTFAGWKIEPGPLTLQLPNGRALWAQAQEIRKQVESGAMHTGTPALIDGEATTTEPAPRREAPRRAAEAATSDEDIPF